MIKKLQTSCLLIICLWMSACGWIDDDLSACIDNPRGIDIFLSFHTEGQSDINPLDIGYIALYVFDRAGQFVGVYSDVSPDLSQEDYFMHLPLEEEEFLLVMWGNAREESPYQTFVSTFEEAILLFTGEETEGVFSHLFYGFLDTSAENTRSAENLRYIIPVHQNTYTITTTVRGLPSSVNYRLSIADWHQGYLFDNSPVPSEEIIFTSLCEKIF